MTVVVGTAGHIDHGKTALLLALTGIDADRLPEERRRGMTIDVGYAHLALPDGTELDFVDVPGHGKLVGNMLVGAGEIDAVMLVVAADDGPRAQTIEHVELLNALGVRHGIAVITKVDLVDAARVAQVREATGRLLADTTLAGVPVMPVSSVDGGGIAALRGELINLRDRVDAARVSAASGSARSRLPIDRVFSVRGRGVVVTGTLRGGPLARNVMLRLIPGGATLRVRELQVHGSAVEQAGPGRTAINLVGGGIAALRRGIVLTDDPQVVATDRLVVALGRPMVDRARVRVHLGTASIDGAIGRSGRDAIDLPNEQFVATLRLSELIAAAPGDRFVLRRSADTDAAIGGIVLDTSPPRGVSHRRQTTDRVRALAEAIQGRAVEGEAAAAAARLDLHGVLASSDGEFAFADDVAGTVLDAILVPGASRSSGHDASAPFELVRARAYAGTVLRGLVTIRRDRAAAAATALVERFVLDGRFVRDGEWLRLPGANPPAPDAANPGLVQAMNRLERALWTAAPPPLADAARRAGCPASGIVELERAGRIVILEPDLAYEASTYRTIELMALDLAGRAPLTPAALRDATGTSRKFVMAILADLDRRGVLRRTAAGHVPGPRASSARAEAPGATARSEGPVASSNSVGAGRPGSVSGTASASCSESGTP